MDLDLVMSGGVVLMLDFTSVCYDYVLLSLVNKETALACGRIKLGGKTKLNARRK